MGSTEGRGASRGCRAGVSGLRLRPLSVSRRAEGTGQETRGGRRAGCLAGCHPRHAVPGREQGGRLLGRLRTGHWAWGRRGGSSAGGDPQKVNSLPRPAASGFPICRDGAGQRGRGRALSTSPPPCSQRPRPRARGGRGRRGWGGRVDTLGAPFQQRPTPPSSQRRWRKARREGRWKRSLRRSKATSIPPAKGGLQGAGARPVPVATPRLRHGAKGPLTGGGARGNRRGASPPQGLGPRVRGRDLHA